jgi:hypothetical protein
VKEGGVVRPIGWNLAILATVAVALGSSTASSQDGAPGDGARSAIEGLRARDVDARRAAANRVRLSGRDLQREALPVLIDLLMKEKDGQVRLAVLDAVTSLGPERRPPSPRSSIPCGPIMAASGWRSRTRIIGLPWRWRPSAGPPWRVSAAS